MQTGPHQNKQKSLNVQTAGPMPARGTQRWGLTAADCFASAWFLQSGVSPPKPVRLGLDSSSAIVPRTTARPLPLLASVSRFVKRGHNQAYLLGLLVRMK